MMPEAKATTVPTLTFPAGFIGAGIACGIKPSGADDLALIYLPEGGSAAAVFTTNQVRAAPIAISQENLNRSRGRARALLINSGCANAATGPDGERRARETLQALAAELDCPPEQILINSTGVIGQPLPTTKITNALVELIHACSPARVENVAAAITTTDICTKVSHRTVRDPQGGRACCVVGIAKGSGMIHPNMATMIAAIMTDAACDATTLDRMLRDAVDKSFHRISVDGDTSTNDAAYLLASGASGPVDESALAPVVTEVAKELAEKIVRDGEGATKLIRVRVRGAATDAEALRMARTVAGSMLVRTSIAGADPNWGRILAAAGRSGVAFDPSRFTLAANGHLMYDRGRPADTPPATLRAAYECDEIALDLTVGDGPGDEACLTCDLTEQYVRINAEYTT